MANAGLNSMGAPVPGEDGLGQVFKANFLSHFLMLQRLLPSLVATGSAACPARVVLLSSVMHHLAAPATFPKAAVAEAPQYNASKLAMTILASEVMRRLAAGRGQAPHVIAASVNPGAVNSDIWRHMPAALALFARPLFRLLFLDTRQGSETSVYAATSPELPGCWRPRGSASPYIVPYYALAGSVVLETMGPFAGARAGAPNPAACDAKAGADLWELALRLVHQSR